MLFLSNQSVTFLLVFSRVSTNTNGMTKGKTIKIVIKTNNRPKILVEGSKVPKIFLVIPFVCTGAWVETYVENLQKYIEDTQLINTVTTLILSVFSPIIFYRPMMAWIG